jgi:hypothetical protein
MKKIIATLTLTMLLISEAHANMIAFDEATYSGSAGDTITVTVNYDFTSYSMFGGGLDLLFDSNVVGFKSFNQNLPSDADPVVSPVGALAGDLYGGFGIGTFDFFNGMNSAGIFAIFEFELLAPPASGAPATLCGEVLCLYPNSINPLVSLAGAVVSADFFSAGFLGAAVEVLVDPSGPTPVPAPFTLSLFGIGLIGLGWSRRKKA